VADARVTDIIDRINALCADKFVPKRETLDHMETIADVVNAHIDTLADDIAEEEGDDDAEDDDEEED
jgi:hypothetical protein